MQKIERGFEAFIGETVVGVDTSSINVTHFHCESGKVISVDAEYTRSGTCCPQVSEGYNVVPKVFEELSWQQLEPTHKADNNLYAKWQGKWQCFYLGWEYADNQSDKFFESGTWGPDDKLKPL